RLSVAGISTERVYPKSEILELKRAAKPVESKPSPTKAGSPKPEAAVENGVFNSGGEAEAVVDVDGKAIPPGTLKVYVVTFNGEFARDVSKTPVQEWMKDVLRVQPDVLIVKFDGTFSRYGREVLDFAQMGPGQYDMLEAARELDTLISDRIAHDPAFKTK